MAQSRRILRRNCYGSYLGLKKRGQRVRTMPAHDPAADVAHLGETPFSNDD
jgi:hypothetical protein